MTEEKVFDRSGTRFIIKIWNDADKALLSYFENHVLKPQTGIEDIYRWLTYHNIFYTVNYSYIRNKWMLSNIIGYIKYRLHRRGYYLSDTALRKAAMNDEIMSDIMVALDDSTLMVREI